MADCSSTGTSSSVDADAGGDVDMESVKEVDTQDGGASNPPPSIITSSCSYIASCVFI